MCGSSDRLAAHHVVRKVLFDFARFETGNGITLCSACHREPHEVFNRRPDLAQPMDADGGENIELLACMYANLVEDATARKLLRDDYYFLSDHTLESFKRCQGFEHHNFPGTRLEQAAGIWRGSPLQVMSTLLEANGFGADALAQLLSARGIERR